VDPTGADVDAVCGQPQRAAALPLQPEFLRGEEIRRHEGGVLAAKE
jgi:hypothetical protein